MTITATKVSSMRVWIWISDESSGKVQAPNISDAYQELEWEGIAAHSVFAACSNCSALTMDSAVCQDCH